MTRWTSGPLFRACGGNYPAVYAIIIWTPYPNSRAVVVYIGSTRNFYNRHADHRSALENLGGIRLRTWFGEFDAFAGVEIRYRKEKEIGEAAMAEIKLIRRLRPVGNKKLMGSIR